MPKGASTNPKKRIEIPFFEGLNALVSSNISKKQEMEHVENARATQIGTIEKRAGTRRLGDALSCTANYDLFYFENDGTTNTGFFRISTSSGSTKVFYLNTSAAWTALTDADAIGLYELGDSTTQFDITNPSGDTHRYTYDASGTDPDIDAHIRVGSELEIAAQNFSAGNNGTFTVTGVGSNYFEVTNASGVVESNKTIGTGSITINGGVFDHVVAENNVFIVNGHHDNFYISGTDGTTAYSSALSTGHLYNSPKAHKITHYKDRLYLGDYTDSNGVRTKNGVMMSSMPLGIVALADGDHDSGVTTVNVTDTKYIQASDSLDVYRGGTKIGTLTVTAKTEYALTVSATGFAINSADELWVSDTNAGTAKVFRWADSPSSGVAVKEYDTFKLSGEEHDRIKLLDTIGDVLIIGNNNNISVWDNYSLKGMDVGVGCVSDKGYVKAMGSLFFVHYTGIYATNGGRPRLISPQVERFFTGATKTGLEASSMGRKGYSIFAHIGDVTLYYPDGSVDRTLSNVVVEFNMRQENWYLHTGIDAKAFATYFSSSDADRLEFIDDTDYNVYEFLTGDTDDQVTSDNAIPMRIDTSNITLAKQFEKFCHPTEVIIESERGSATKCFISLDNGPFYELQGEAVKGCTILKVHNRSNEESKPPRCRRIRLSLRDYSRKRCRISRIALRYIETDEEENLHEEPFTHG